MSQDAANPAATNSTEMVKVTQLPVIEDQLRAIKTWVEDTVANVDAMVCNEDTLLEVKSFRTDLNHLFAELEIRRKDVLKEVEAPINQFKDTYKECVSDYFKRADTILKEKITAVESEMKGACETRLRAYFDELAQANGLDWLKYEQAGIVVSMADARAKTQPPQKLRKQLENFVLRVLNDVDTILDLKNGSEILAAYKEALNVTDAIQTVETRRRQIERAEEEKSLRNAVKAQEEAARQKVEAFAPPTVSKMEAVAEKMSPTEDLLSCTFTITDTLDRLRLLKQFLDANGYKYTN